MSKSWKSLADQTEAELRVYRPGDEFGTFWPSDTLVNISADARVLAASGARAFRDALGSKTK